MKAGSGGAAHRSAGVINRIGDKPLHTASTTWGSGCSPARTPSWVTRAWTFQAVYKLFGARRKVRPTDRHRPRWSAAEAAQRSGADAAQLLHGHAGRRLHLQGGGKIAVAMRKTACAPLRRRKPEPLRKAYDGARAVLRASACAAATQVELDLYRKWTQDRGYRRGRPGHLRGDRQAASPSFGTSRRPGGAAAARRRRGTAGRWRNRSRRRARAWRARAGAGRPGRAPAQR